jgi:hypothetical protein
MFEERQKPLSGPFMGRVGHRDALDYLLRRVIQRTFSSGSLEDYARCPFVFFIKRVMRLETPQGAERESFDAGNQGTLIHQVLRSFMEEAREAKLHPLKKREPAELLKKLEEHFDAACRRWEADKAFTKSPAWALDRERLAAQLPRVLEALIESEEEGFIPVEFEFHFGFGDERKGATYSRADPIPLELPSGTTITLRGIIDRLDVSAGKKTSVRPIDYKTGKFFLDGEQELRSGTALQSGVYLIAAAAIADAPLDELSESGYVHVLGDSAGKKRLLTGRDEFLGKVKAAIDAIVDGIGKGVFCPLPAGVVKGMCGWCEYGDTCGPAGPTFGERLKYKDPARKVRERLDEFE